MKSQKSVSGQGRSASPPVKSRPHLAFRGLVILQVAFWIAAIALLIWAFVDPRFRSSEGVIQGSICLPVASAIALGVLGWGIIGPIRNFTFWFTLALIGQAAALQMIDAGPLVHYQHYIPIDLLTSGVHPVSLLVILVQTGFILGGLWTHWSKIVAWIRSSFKWWQLVFIGMVFFFSTAAVQRDITRYAGDWIFSSFVQIVNLANILLIAWSFPSDMLIPVKDKLDRVIGHQIDEHITALFRIDRFVLTAAIWVTVTAGVISYLSYEWHPHITDEFAYLYQARLIANGSLTQAAPPVPEAFDIYLMEFQGDRWFPSTPPGWPALLAIGVRLGLPGLVNPLLTGINVILAYLLLQELYGLHSARLGLLLLCVSPWFVFMGINYMTHMFTLTCFLSAAVGVIRARSTQHARWGWFAGAAVGMGSLIRPLDGLIAGVLIGLWVIGIGGKRLQIPAIVGFTAGAILIGAIVLPYNKLLTGDMLTFPLNKYLDEHFGAGRNNLGFGPDRGYGWALQPFPGHSPLGALINAELNTFSINTELFGWAAGSLLFTAFFLSSGALRKSDYLMLAICVAIFGLYFFYYYSGGPDFGARYWFLMLIPFIAFTVRGIGVLQTKLSSGSGEPINAETRVMVALLSLSLIAVINYFPWRAIDKYHDFWGMRPDIVRLAKEYSFGRSLVLIRGEVSHPDFTSTAIYNPLDWNADEPVYAWDKNPMVESQLLKAFPNRLVWIVDAPSLTNEGYLVIEGPLTEQDVLNR
jgi:hypothetical protein